MTTCQIRRVWKGAAGADVRGPWEPCPTCRPAPVAGSDVNAAAHLAAAAWQRMPFAAARQLPVPLQMALDALWDAIQGGAR